MNEAASRILKRWQSVLDYSILMSLFGIGYVTVIYYAKMAGGCTGTLCFDANHPAVIAIGDLLSMSSIYITILALGISGRLAMVLYHLNRAQSQGEGGEGARRTRSERISNNWIVFAGSLLVFLTVLFLAATGSVAEHSDSPIKLEFGQGDIGRDVLTLAITMYFVFPSGVGAGFVLILPFVFRATQNIMRDR